MFKPWSVYATIEGITLLEPLPLWVLITDADPHSQTATQDVVVPRSIPMIFFMLLIDYEVDVFLQELIGQAVERLRKLYVLFFQLEHGFGNASSYVVEL